MDALPANEAVSNGIVDEGVSVAVVLEPLVDGEKGSHEAHKLLVFIIVSMLQGCIHKVHRLDHLWVHALFVYPSTFVNAVVESFVDTLDEPLVALHIKLDCVHIFRVLNQSGIIRFKQSFTVANMKNKDEHDLIHSVGHYFIYN